MPSKPLGQIITTTDRLSLHAPVMDDVKSLAALWSDPETMRYIGDGSAWSIEKVTQRIDRAISTQNQRGMTFWTIAERDTNTIIGQGGLVPIEFQGPEIELGYRIGRDHWGKGYASEIARASAEYGFVELGLAALVAVTHSDNLASRRVLIKAGFREEGPSDLYYAVPTIVHRMSPDDLLGRDRPLD